MIEIEHKEISLVIQHWHVNQSNSRTQNSGRCSQLTVVPPNNSPKIRESYT